MSESPLKKPFEWCLSTQTYQAVFPSAVTMQDVLLPKTHSNYFQQSQLLSNQERSVLLPDLVLVLAKFMVPIVPICSQVVTSLTNLRFQHLLQKLTLQYWAKASYLMVESLTRDSIAMLDLLAVSGNLYFSDPVHLLFKELTRDSFIAIDGAWLCLQSSW